MKGHLLFLTLLAACILAFRLHNYPTFFPISDTAIYADLATSLLQGRGFVSSITTPLFLTSSPHPYVPSLFPLSIVPAFYFLGLHDSSIYLVSSIFFILSVLLLYLLATRLSTPTGGLTAAVWYMLLPQSTTLGALGMSESLNTLLLLLAVYFFFGHRQLTSGLFLGLAYLTRFQSLFFLPFIAFSPTFLIPPLISFFLTPYHAPNYLWALVAEDAYAPIHPILNSLPVFTLTSTLAHLSQIFVKFSVNLFHFLKDAPSAPLLALLAFALASPKLKAYFLAIFALYLTFHLFTLSDPRYLQPLVPFLCLLASLGLHTLRPSLRLLFLGFFAVLPFVISLRTSFTPLPIAQFQHVITTLVPPDATIASNFYAYLPWYTHHPSLPLPPTPADLLTVAKTFPVGAILISDYPNQSPPPVAWTSHPHIPGYYLAVRQVKPIPLLLYLPLQPKSSN